MSVPSRTPSRASTARRLALLLAALLILSLVPAGVAGAQAPEPDPRQGLAPGTDTTTGATAGNAYTIPRGDAETASWNAELLANRVKPRWQQNGVDSAAGAFSQSNLASDLAFTGDYAIAGNYRGFIVYDVSDPANPVETTVVNCVGGQGDVSVYGDLLFVSVEATTARVDCSTSTASTVFRGIRIFDISDVTNPRHVGGVQTCRGSHTHTVVEDPDDPAHVYIYNSGAAGVRSAAQLAGCSNTAATNPGTSLWSIDVIRVPLAAPQDAAILRSPRIFTNPETGAINGLQNSPPTPQHPAGINWSPSPVTNHCHDMTAYVEIGLLAGACAGNGILLDITDPANPVRVADVADPNFAYWHSATFNNDGTTVVFTDEWGGGFAARCQAQFPEQWGGNAIYDIVDGQFEFASYYKIPGVQAANEGCVAHNGNLVPIPGRDVMVQAWYEGGMSAFDFTDSANPREIAFFDRGPYHPTQFPAGGYWSVYWYNGHVFGNEIFLGFDSLALKAGDHLSANELAAAASARVPELNAQAQQRITFPASFTTVRGFVDSARYQGVLHPDVDANLTKFVDRAERHATSANAGLRAASAANLRAVANQLGDSAVEGELADALRALAATIG